MAKAFMIEGPHKDCIEVRRDLLLRKGFISHVLCRACPKPRPEPPRRMLEGLVLGKRETKSKWIIKLTVPITRDDVVNRTVAREQL